MKKKAIREMVAVTQLGKTLLEFDKLGVQYELVRDGKLVTLSFSVEADFKDLAKFARFCKPQEAPPADADADDEEGEAIHDEGSNCRGCRRF